MASTLTESTPVFKERAAVAGLTAEDLACLAKQGLDTLAKLAFACGQPGETPSDDAIKALIRPAPAAGVEDAPEPSLGSVSALRRLLFESQTLMISQVKSLVESREDQVKELPTAERQDRIRRQAARLSGVSLSGPGECSYASYDLCMQLLMDNSVRYLPPSKFTTRQSELRMEKPRKELEIANSNLTIKDKTLDFSCDTSTALSLHHALHRRALALDLVGLSTYSKVLAYNEFLLNHLVEEPTAGFRATTVQQVLEADRAAWVRLAEPKGVRAGSDGILPLDSLWERVQLEPRVAYKLMPVPGSAPKSTTALDDPDTERPPKRPRRDKGKGKGRTKGQPASEPANTPAELKGLSFMTKRGGRRCWNFNMACGCKAAKVGQDCPRGSHTCMRCGGHHGAHECPKKGS